MARKGKRGLCRICRKREPWRYKNCPPGICKRCYHKVIWPKRLEAVRRAQSGEGEDADDVLAEHLLLDGPGPTLSTTPP